MNGIDGDGRSTDPISTHLKKYTHVKKSNNSM